MQELVDFLIEERYCNSELEAIKILESVSDGFYEYLVEKYNVNRFAPERVMAITNRINSLKSQAQNNPTSVTDPVKFRRNIKFLQGVLSGPIDNQKEKAKAEMQRRIDDKEVKVKKGSLPTPNRGKPQKPKNVPTGKTTIGSYSNIDRNTSSVEKQARRLSGGMPSGSESQRSVYSSPTAVVTGGRHGTVHGGRGTQRDRTTGGVVGVKKP
jgi:hypothetical protein